MMPVWFKNALKMSGNVCHFVDNRGCQINNTLTQQKTAYTFWYGLSTIDIDSTLQANSFTGSSATVPQNNSRRAYMFAHSATHIWKNNAAGPAVLETYLLIPRRDMPVYVNNGGIANTSDIIAPPATYSYGDAVRQNPSMYTQSFTDYAGTDANPNKVTGNDMSATPFMSSNITSLFKIKRLKVNGPSGKTFVTTLLPGQTASLDVNHPKPMSVSYNKYGLNALTASNVSKSFEVLKETPLIFAYVKGGLGHGKLDTNIVGVTKAYLDYQCKRHWKRLYVNASGMQSAVMVTPTALATSEEALENQAQIVEE